MAGASKKKGASKARRDESGRVESGPGREAARIVDKPLKSGTYIRHDRDGGIIPEVREPAAAPYGSDSLPPHPGVRQYRGRVRESIREIKAGLPMACFDELREALGCSQESLAAVAGIPGRTLARRRREGRFRPDEGERVLRLVGVFAAVLGLFEGDVAAARRWLKTPQELFEGRAPLEYCDTEPGAGFVREVAGRLEHGVFS